MRAEEKDKARVDEDLGVHYLRSVWDDNGVTICGLLVWFSRPRLHSRVARAGVIDPDQHVSGRRLAPDDPRGVTCMLCLTQDAR